MRVAIDIRRIGSFGIGTVALLIMVRAGLRPTTTLFTQLLLAVLALDSMTAQAPQAQPAQPGPSCSEILDRFVDLRGDRKQLSATWVHCPSHQVAGYSHWEPRHDFVRLSEWPSGNHLFTFGPVDELVEMKIVDVDGDNRSELLLVGIGAGTGNDLTWCVLIADGRELQCLTPPDLGQLERQYLRDGEHLCCKDWKLKSDLRTIVLARGIYAKGDGNCCPTRGAIFVEIGREDSKLAVRRSKRSSLRTYEDWILAPSPSPSGW